MKILVTGGCGFIGSLLVQRLVEKNHDIVVFDKVKGKQNVKYIIGDIRNPDEVEKAIKGCEIVFHLAALTDLRNIENDYAVNFLGAKNVFDIAKKNNAKIVFASSAAVYGNAKLPISENSECSPISQYGKSKLKAERLLGENDLMLRFFNVYGPRGKSVINTFCKKIPKYEEITVYGTGLQTRDYVYVTDVVDALLLGLGDISGVFNVGTGVETKLLDIIDIIHRLTKAKPFIKFEMPKENEIKRSVADITKIKQTGWAPKVSLEGGIRKILSL